MDSVLIFEFNFDSWLAQLAMVQYYTLNFTYLLTDWVSIFFDCFVHT